MTDKNRYYVAVAPPISAREHLSNSLVHSTSGSPGMRWAPSEDWHITLAFLDEEIKDMASLHELLAGAARNCASMQLTLAGAGQFGDQVLWIGVDGQVDRLIALAEWTRMATGASTEFDFVPHLTVGKVNKDAPSTDVIPMLVGSLARYRGHPWRVDRLHLMLSHSGSEWGIDQSVASWPMEGR